VAEGDDGVLAEADADISTKLPITASVHKVTLLEEIAPSMARWQTRATFPLLTS
jgi:hypothetical protein